MKTVIASAVLACFVATVATAVSVPADDGCSITTQENSCYRDETDYKPLMDAATKAKYAGVLITRIVKPGETKEYKSGVLSRDACFMLCVTYKPTGTDTRECKTFVWHKEKKRCWLKSDFEENGFMTEYTNNGKTTKVGTGLVSAGKECVLDARAEYAFIQNYAWNGPGCCGGQNIEGLSKGGCVARCLKQTGNGKKDDPWRKPCSRITYYYSKKEGKNICRIHNGCLNAKFYGKDTATTDKETYYNTSKKYLGIDLGRSFTAHRKCLTGEVNGAAACEALLRGNTGHTGRYMEDANGDRVTPEVWELSTCKDYKWRA